MKLTQPYRIFLHSCMLLLALWAIAATSVSAQTPGITNPTPGQVVSDVVIVTGTATSGDFLRFELAFLRDATPETGWIVFADGERQVVDGTLAVWDTTVGQNVNAPIYPDGTYQLRLRVVRNDFNYDEFFVGNLVIQNGTSAEVPTQPPPPPPPTETPIPTDEPQPQPPTEVPTSVVEEQTPPDTPVDENLPTPTPSATPTEIPTATPLPTRDAPTAVPTIILEPTLEGPPEVLPTLTAFPSPTPEATRDQTAFNIVAPEGDGSEEQQIEGVNGLVEAVFGYDYGQFGNAFNQGFRWTFILFAVIAVYLIIRAAVRWLWETISSNW